MNRKRRRQLDTHLTFVIKLVGLFLSFQPPERVADWTRVRRRWLGSWREDILLSLRRDHEF
jgi:hypothetical protein